MTFPNIEKEIKNAQKILGYEEGWDGDGALPPCKKSLKEAFGLVRLISKKNKKDFFTNFSINPCPNGSIDIGFYGSSSGKDVRLCINLDKDRRIHFYGKNYNTGEEIETGRSSDTLFSLCSFIKENFSAAQ